MSNHQQSTKQPCETPVSLNLHHHNNTVLFATNTKGIRKTNIIEEIFKLRKEWNGTRTETIEMHFTDFFPKHKWGRNHPYEIRLQNNLYQNNVFTYASSMESFFSNECLYKLPFISVGGGDTTDKEVPL